MEIDDCVEEYICELRLLKRTPETIKGYSKRLRYFERYCENARSVSRMEEVNVALLKSYSLFLIESGVKAITANGYLTPVKKMFKFAHSEGYVDSDFSRGFVHQKEDKTVIPCFTEKQVEQLFGRCKPKRGDSSRDRFIKARDNAVLTVLFDSGLRASELCGIRESDMVGDCILIRGKGSKERVVPITSPMRKAIGKYKHERDRYFSDGRFRLDDRLLLTFNGKQLKPKTLGAIFSKLGKGDMFKSVRCSPHTARHYYAVKMLTSQGASVYEIQRLMGHANLNYTNIYLSSLTDEELIKNNRDKSVLMGL